MGIFGDIVLTRIFPPVTVFSEKGRIAVMTKRSSYGLSFCLGGQITYTLGETKTVSDPNVAVLLPEGMTYSLHGDREGLFPLINFQCEGFFLDRVAALPLRNPKEYVELYKKIEACSARENRLGMFSAFYEILHRLEKELQKKPPVVCTAEDAIADAVSDPTLSCAKIAARLGVSEVYLRKLFSLHNGVPPKRYIMDMRILLAKQFLSNTADTVTSVSEKCGFASVYHFCRVFKEKTGCTPSEYSKQNRVYRI